MTRLRQLYQDLETLDAQLADVGRAIAAVPDSLPWSQFCRRLNSLEACGLALEERRKAIRREIEMYEEILAEVRDGGRARTVSVSPVRGQLCAP